MSFDDAEPTAADVMQRNVISLLPEMTLREATECLFEKNVTAAPVLDADGQCLGILSLTDLAGFARRAVPGSPLYRFRGRTLSTTFVRELMTSRVVSVRTTTTLDGVRQTLQRLGLNHVPVVQPDGRLAGVVSASDIERYAMFQPSIAIA